jgi:beta-glucosidase/6-phospho-beta-glucosidase/beta-galactosidase
MQRRPRRYVTLEGYAVEGGLDGPYQPSTCYRPTIALGRHAAPGDGDNLWREYEQVLDLVPGLGVDGVRLSVEWTRVEPRRGEVDDAALARYADVARYATSLGLGVTATIVDAAWPSWLGLEAWLLPWVVPYVVDHARRVASSLDDDVRLVIFASVDELVTGGFLESSSPPWRRAARVDAQLARAQIEALLTTLRADPLVGPRLVASSATIALARPPTLIARALRDVADVDEVYLRSLVKGSGPTASSTGIAERRDGHWRVVASDALLDVLR